MRLITRGENDSDFTAGMIVCVHVFQNGEIFVFTGMLQAVADIHQLVFILGHEMAHALIGHAVSPALSDPCTKTPDWTFLCVILSETILIQ